MSFDSLLHVIAWTALSVLAAGLWVIAKQEWAA